MKRFLACILVLVFSAVAASAAAIKITGLSEKNLYELASEIQSQIQLNQLRKKAAYEPVIRFDDLERNPDKYAGKLIYFKGRILQAVTGNQESTYRIVFGGDSEKVFLVTYAVPENAERLLEDDDVCVYGKFLGVETDSGATGETAALPFCSAALMIHPVNNTEVKKAAPEELEQTLADIRELLRQSNPKANGYVKLTEKNYNDYTKNGKLHAYERISFSGWVQQVTEGDEATTIHVSIDKRANRMVYLTVPKHLLEFRILEHDGIDVKGTFTGLYSYAGTHGEQVTVPSCEADSLVVKGYKPRKKLDYNQDGNIRLTKRFYSEFTRRPDLYLNEPVAFYAKVVQVFEGSKSSEYRMAVDGWHDAMVDVVLPAASRTIRILEDDSVSVTGTFTGFMTYQSPSGASFTIPECSASSVVLSGKKPETAKKDASGKYTVTKQNYKFFARNADACKSEPLAFTAKVVQIVRHGDSTTYLLAVDKDSDCMFLAVIDNDKRNMQILEDDIVFVEGACAGLCTYSSALAGMITVPAVTVTGMK